MNILEKNLQALTLKNTELAKKILGYVPTDVPQLIQQNGTYNFLYKGKYLHNPLNPLGEAKEIFSMAKNEPVAIHFVYGIGLGYLFQVVSANSQGTVILYEPDLNILKMAFSLVDFSNDILKPNVNITDSLSEAEEYIYQKSNTKNTPLLLSTSTYQELDIEKFNEMVTELQRQVGSFGLDLKYTKEKFYPLTKRIIENIPNIIKEIPLTELKDKFKGKTAVVVSAGPTLDRNIETIKKYRNNVVLITVGTAVRTLISNEIIPDFLCIIESNDCSKQIEGLDLSRVNFVTELFSHPNIKNREFKKVFSHISSNMPVNSLWCDIAGITNEEYFSKGTVSYTALNTARILGCSKIVLVGQDLAYIEGQCYSKDSAYRDLECRFNKELNKWEIAAKDFDNFVKSLGNETDPELQKGVAIERLENLNKSLYFVKGIRGDMIPTESVYAAFIKPLTEFTQNFPDRTYINTSLVGAQIDGFENLSLEEALLDSSQIQAVDTNVDFKYNINLIKDNLFKLKGEIQPALMITEEIKKTCKSLNNDIKRYKNVTVEILKGLKKVSTGYTALSTDYVDKCKIFDYITIAERIEMDYQMKMFKDINVQTVSNMINNINHFCDETEVKISEISSVIDNVLEVL